MYSFFRSNGSLGENIMPDRLYAGSQFTTNIYIYWDNLIWNTESKWDVNRSIEAVYYYGNNYASQATSSTFTKVFDGIESIMPRPKDIEYFYFRGGKQYQFIKLTVPYDVVSTAGSVRMVLRIIDQTDTPDKPNIYVIGDLTFKVDGQYLQDQRMTESQFNAIQSQIGLGVDRDMKPTLNNSVDLGDESHQYDDAYAKMFYENGVALNLKYLGATVIQAEDIHIDY